ncbi:hypothetical protein BO94DRAFT_457164, partial [Aspergillus sclerotioniger CBS 115572]
VGASTSSVRTWPSHAPLTSLVAPIFSATDHLRRSVMLHWHVPGLTISPPELDNEHNSWASWVHSSWATLQ